jgi:hypothetical protein
VERRSKSVAAVAAVAESGWCCGWLLLLFLTTPKLNSTTSSLLHSKAFQLIPQLVIAYCVCAHDSRLMLANRQYN